MELLAEPAEDRLGPHGVLVHRVQQAGGTALRRDSGGGLRHHQVGEEHGTEQLPSDLQCDGPGRAGRVLKYTAGPDQVDHVGHRHEDAADQGDEHDGARHVLARFDGLLGDGGDSVELEERVRGDGGAGGDGGEAGRVVEVCHPAQDVQAVVLAHHQRNVAWCVASF